MVEEYTFRDLIHRAIQGCGYDKDDLFVKTVDYSFQPFYDIAINGSILDHLTSLSISKEFETRIHEKAAECPELNDPRYNGMFTQIIRWMIASQFNDNTIEKGIKYHLADKFESTLNELIYIKGNPDSREKLKDDFRFIQNKKEEYKDFKKGKDLDAFW